MLGLALVLLGYALGIIGIALPFFGEWGNPDSPQQIAGRVLLKAALGSMIGGTVVSVVTLVLPRGNRAPGTIAALLGGVPLVLLAIPRLLDLFA